MWGGLQGAAAEMMLRAWGERGRYKLGRQDEVLVATVYAADKSPKKGVPSTGLPLFMGVQVRQVQVQSIDFLQVVCCHE